MGTNVVPSWDVSEHAARSIVDTVTADAAALGRAVTVAVTDRSGILVAFARMDGAPAFSAGLAVEKARTAAAFGRPTAALETLMDGRPAFAQSFTQHGGWYLGRGGHPLLHDGHAVGGVGVSGDAADYEDDAARTAAEAFSS